MNSNGFPVFKTIKRAFETYRVNLSLYIGLSMMSVSIVIFAWAIDKLLGIQFLSVIAITFISIAMIMTSIRTLKGKDTEFSDYFKVYRIYPIYLISSFVAYFAIGTAAVFFFLMMFAVGIMAIPMYAKVFTIATAAIPLLLPAIYIGTRIQFYGFIQAEVDWAAGNMIYESLEKSWEITKGKSFDILLLDLAVVSMICLGIAFIGIGLLVALPVSFLVMMHAYDTLRGDIKLPEAKSKDELSGL